MTKFPDNFFDIAGWDFEKVWKEKRGTFCRFALGWQNPTGLFLEFQTFCKSKIKEDGYVRTSKQIHKCSAS